MRWIRLDMQASLKKDHQGGSALYCVFGLLGLDQVPPQSSQETGSRALLLFAGAREHKSHPRFSPIQDSPIHESCDSCCSDSHHAVVETSCPSLVAHPYFESSRTCADEAQMT